MIGDFVSETGNPLLDAFKQLQPDLDVVVLPSEPSLALITLSKPAGGAVLPLARVRLMNGATS